MQSSTSTVCSGQPALEMGQNPSYIQGKFGGSEERNSSVLLFIPEGEEAVVLHSLGLDL